MYNRLVIIGAGGHGKVIADIALKNGYTDIAFADDNAVGLCMGFPIVCTFAELDRLNDGKTDFVIAVGNNKIRQSIAEKYALNWVTLVHPSAQIGANVTIGRGTIVMAGAVINPCTTVGAHCIINTCSSVDHDCKIDDYAHVSPGAHIAGTVTVGKRTWIGAGAIVSNNISITEGCMIGAGAVVIKDCKEAGTYVGVPARKTNFNP